MVDFYAILPGSLPAGGGAGEVGNKAWNLMLMARAGLPVPPAFVLPTAWCGRTQPEQEANLGDTLSKGIAALETATGLAFGSAQRPLLVSVRSGAAVSMPGMMETVLDVGLNAETVGSLIRLTGNPRLAWDSYRRLVQGYAEVVANLATAPFDTLVAAALIEGDAENERALDHRSLRALTRAMLDCYSTLAGSDFPNDPHEQLAGAVKAVFRSWGAPKAASYRQLKGIGDAAGTAVTVQTMVYGNAGGESGAGVAFTRNPATGARELYFDFQFNAQGEDVVAGRHKLRDNERLHLVLPTVWSRLNDICHALEALFHDAQDFEFTMQSGALYLLQTRRAKRTDWAALAIAVDMVAEGLLKPAEALARLDGIDLGAVVRTTFALPVPATLAMAQVAGMGVASGAIALDPDAVKRLSAAGHGDDGHRGHGAGGRHPDRFGWPHFPRGGCRAPAGQGLSGRLPWAHDRPGAPPVPHRRRPSERGRFPVARRQHWRRSCGPADAPDDAAGPCVGGHCRLAPLGGGITAFSRSDRKHSSASVAARE